VADEGAFLLQFRILGPLEVLRRGECLSFRGSRERALVALLVLNANRIVSTERLAEDLWSGDPPDGAIRSLRVYVSRLRQSLGAGSEAVVTRPSGYGLQVDPEAVDALRFEALVARGRDKAKAGDHTGAAALLREALGLWRGAALADVADAPFARAESNRLEEARLAAVEDRLDADLACGRHGEVTAELDALTREHPFRERLWSQRMVALYRSGRQADALRAYQDLRSTLGEQLGIEPSSALQDVEDAVLRHDPELDWHSLEHGGPRAPAPRLGEETEAPVAGAEPGWLPQPLRREERLPLVGRDVELSRLDLTWQATRSGQRQLVLVAGEPGIGKSRLTADFARTAHGGEAAVLFGRCDEGMGVPYQPFVEALARYLRRAPQIALGRLAGELVRLVPEVGERVDGLQPPLRSDPETERYRLFDAVAAWLGAVSETVPVLFVIEDLHWATKPTLLLLSHLLRSDEDLRLLLLVTFRDTPLDMTPDLADLVAELLRQPGVERLRLAGLDEPSVGALMEAQASHDLDDDGWALARIVHGETAGNPFYVREMLLLLAEKGDIIRRDGRWVPGLPLAKLDVPDSVRDVVERRLTRLPDRTSETLAVAAVLGERFDLAVLAEASGESENSITEMLRPAVSARLVYETDAGSYHFTHALVRSALEDALGPTRAVQLHRAAGSAVEAVHAGHLEAHLPELAHHFARAGDVNKTIEYASRAGDRALVQLAHDEAAAYYRQALEVLDPAGRPDGETQRCELLIALGEAQRRAADSAYRQTLLNAAHLAQQVGDPDALARAALAIYRGFFSFTGLVDAEPVAVLEAALDTTALREDPLRARLLANLAAELHFVGDSARRRALSDESLTIARRFGDPSTLAHVLHARCVAIWEPSTARERLANTEELLGVARRLGDPAVTMFAWVWRALAATEVADLAESDRSVDHVTKLATDLRQPLLLWVASYMRTGRLLLAGRLGDAEHAVSETRQLGVTAGQPDAHLFFGAQRYQLRFEQGRLHELADRLHQVLDERDQPATRAYAALAYCELDRTSDARRVFAPLATRVGELPVDLLWPEVTSLSAAICHSLRDRLLAERLLELLRPFSDQLVGHGVLWWGSVSHYLGLLASTLERYEEAEARFEAAQRAHDQFAAPTWLARTRLEWARMLLTRREPGDGEHARQLLGQALATARELGLANVERRAVELLS
jgi:DNA-binding SARP family transcriptional activator/tetratricopeptide (TPR) repeat protein